VNLAQDQTKPNGSLYDATSWGPGAFVVDAWYANQKQEKPGSNAVKNVTGQDGDPYYDKKFLQRLSQFSFRRPTAFTYTFVASVPGS
jgi:hypothetical protein